MHPLGHRLVVSGCAGYRLQRVANALPLILPLSGELNLGKLFLRPLPKLVAGEVTLFYALLFTTDLADEHVSKEMWMLFVQKICSDVQAGGNGIAMATTAIATLLYGALESQSPFLY